MIGTAAAHQLQIIEAAYRRFRETVDRLGSGGLELTTSAGWTVKEMLAHVAFWEETVNDVVNSMYRGRKVPLEEWYGGGVEGLGLAPGEPWPVADVHNAREAAWARARSADEVLARWDAAHDRMLAVVRTITDEEAESEQYFGKVGVATYRHYAEHLPELDALRVAP